MSFHLVIGMCAKTQNCLLSWTEGVHNRKEQGHNQDLTIGGRGQDAK
jgi:hypothetical protein